MRSFTESFEKYKSEIMHHEKNLLYLKTWKIKGKKVPLHGIGSSQENEKKGFSYQKSLLHDDEFMEKNERNAKGKIMIFKQGL